jgi:hypothetical protein
MGTPEEIVSCLVFARLFESEDKCSLWIHAAKQMPNDAVLAGGVEGLQYDEKGLVIICVK